MSPALALTIIFVGVPLLVLIMLFWLFEKRLFRLYVRWSNWRHYKKTGHKIT